MRTMHELPADQIGAPDEPRVHEAPIRPRDFAYLLLAGGCRPPRQRARDQQADLAGLELKRQVLIRLAALDPEPEAFEAALQSIIVDIGPPYGPARGICLSIRYDWDAACSSPAFITWLLNEAVREGQGEKKRKRRAD